MPIAAPKACGKPGCGAHALPGRGHCAAHDWQQRQAQDERRGTAHERGYDARWQRASKAFLAAHPLCAASKAAGSIEAADVVDHIVPHRGDMRLFWDPGNWQSLSKRCHDKKTSRGG